MLLVFDVGNTNMAVGLYNKTKLIHFWRLSTDQRKTEDEYGLQFLQLFGSIDTDTEEVEGVMISSVVPPMSDTLEAMCRKYFGIKPMVIGPGIKTGLNIRYENPREVGADRIVNAVAAIQEYSGPLIVAALGTASTFCYIDENNQYIGGAIAPGLSVSMDALYKEASKLPGIEFMRPERVIGKNTIHAMQSGVFYGYVGQIDGIINRMKYEMRTKPRVIATGRPADMVSQASTTIDQVEPHLSLKGLQYIYEKNKRMRRKEEK